MITIQAKPSGLRKWYFDRIDDVDWELDPERGKFHQLRQFCGLRLPRIREHWRVTYRVVPLWLILAAVSAPTAFLWYRDRRQPKGHCPSCGYDLTGNVSGVCPECGTNARSENAEDSDEKEAN